MIGESGNFSGDPSQDGGRQGAPSGQEDFNTEPAKPESVQEAEKIDVSHFNTAEDLKLPEYVRQILTKLEDVTAEGTATSGIGQWNNLKSVLKQGLISRGWKGAGKIPDSGVLYFHVVGNTTQDPSSYVHGDVSIIFDLTPFEYVNREMPEKYTERFTHPPVPAKDISLIAGHWATLPSKTYTLNDVSEPRNNNMFGYALANRVAPRLFRGIVLNERVAHKLSSDTYKTTIDQSIETMIGSADGVTEGLLPIYDVKGDLIWPVSMSNVEIKQFIRHELIEKDSDFIMVKQLCADKDMENAWIVFRRIKNNRVKHAVLQELGTYASTNKDTELLKTVLTEMPASVEKLAYIESSRGVFLDNQVVLSMLNDEYEAIKDNVSICPVPWEQLDASDAFIINFLKDRNYTGLRDFVKKNSRIIEVIGFSESTYKLLIERHDTLGLEELISSIPLSDDRNAYMRNILETVEFQTRDGEESSFKDDCKKFLPDLVKFIVNNIKINKPKDAYAFERAIIHALDSNVDINKKIYEKILATSQPGGLYLLKLLVVVRGIDTALIAFHQSDDYTKFLPLKNDLYTLEQNGEKYSTVLLKARSLREDLELLGRLCVVRRINIEPIIHEFEQCLMQSSWPIEQEELKKHIDNLRVFEAQNMLLDNQKG